VLHLRRAGCFFSGKLGARHARQWAQAVAEGRRWLEQVAAAQAARMGSERRGRLMREEARIWIWIQQLWLRERISNTERWERKKSPKDI